MKVFRGIYIDDAGTPGVESKSVFLPEDRKSFSAVLVPGAVESDISEAFHILLQGVERDYGAEELHFTDIYSGRGVWKHVQVEQRIEIFDLMSDLMSAWSIPVFFQTSSLQSELNHMMRDLPMREGVWWDFANVSHQALLFLIKVIADELSSFRKNFGIEAEFHQPFPAVIDEGLMKAGSEVELPAWNNVIRDGKLRFDSSAKCPGLQLADFAAFCIARTQWILGNKEPGIGLSRADKHILSLSAKLNCWNLKLSWEAPELVSRESYEWALMRDRKEKGLPSYPKK